MADGTAGGAVSVARPEAAAMHGRLPTPQGQIQIHQHLGLQLPHHLTHRLDRHGSAAQNGWCHAVQSFQSGSCSLQCGGSTLTPSTRLP
jgi:hypothetical protein